jgi:hypothetical protein
MSRILIASAPSQLSGQDSIDTAERIERAAEQFALDISLEDLQQIIDLANAGDSTLNSDDH